MLFFPFILATKVGAHENLKIRGGVAGRALPLIFK